MNRRPPEGTLEAVPRPFPAMAQTTSSAGAQAKTGPPRTVLVIDGNEEHAILSVTALGRKGFRVISAEGGKEGVRIALAQPFDAIVVGHKLRDATGLEVLRILADKLPRTPKIFVVPADAEDAALRAMDTGAHGYVVKTPRYTELLPAMVEDKIHEAETRRRLEEKDRERAQVITERKTAEEKLSQSEARLRLLLKQAPILLWTTDADLRVTSATGAGLVRLEALRDMPRGLTLYEYFNTRDRDVEPIASHLRALAGESVASEVEWLGRVYELHVEPLRSADGTVTGSIGVAFEVTERKHTEESLRRSEERFHMLGRATNDVVWDWDLQTDGQWMNENVTTVFGYPAEEIEPTGVWWASHVHPDDRDRVEESLQDAIRSGARSWSAEYRFRRHNGTYATVVDRGYVIHDPSERPVRVVGSVMDVTRERRAEAIQSAVYRISDAAHSAKDLPEMYAEIHKIIGGLMPATNFYIALYDEKGNTLSFPYFVDEEESPPPPQKPGKGLTEYVLRTRRPLLASPEVFEGLVRTGDVVSVGPPSVDWVGAPLVSEGKVIGVIVVQSYTEGVRFTGEDKAILNFVSEQVAMAIERKRSQDNLVQTTSELRAIFQAVPDLYFRLQADGTVLGHYAGRTSDLVVPPASFLGKRIQDILPPDIAKPFGTILRKVLHEKRLATLEYDLPVSAGLKHVEARVLPFLDDQLIVVVRDVTERREVQQAIARSEDRYKPMFNNNPQPMWVFDRETLRFLAVNDAAARHYGYSREEFLSMSIKDIRPADDVPRLIAVVKNLGGGMSKSGVWRHRKKDGTLIDVEIFSHFLDFDGRDAQLVLVADVTEKLRAIGAVQESNEALAALFEASPLGILALDREGKIMVWNPASERIFGWSAADVVGRAPPMLPADKEDETKWMREVVLKGGGLAGFETRRMRKDGSLVDVSVSSAPLRDAHGSIRGIMAVYEDISRRKEMERRLVESERLATMGQLAGFIAHELNTPLTSISLLTTAISRRAKDAFVREKLEKINVERRRAAGIIRELLNFSSHRQLMAVDTDLRSVIAAAVEQVEPYQKKGVELSLELGERPAVRAVDPVQMQEVVLNLLKNAFEVTERGTVRVRLEERPDAFAIVVEDTGSGMSPEVLSHLYEPFFTTKGRGEGVGLGLLLSKNVVVSHGGTMDVESESGKGSIFSVVLPKEAGP